MCQLFTETYVIEGVEIPDKNIYSKIIKFFDGLYVDKNEWYKMHPTKKLINVLIDVFSNPETEAKLLDKAKKYSSVLEMDRLLSYMNIDIAYNEIFTIEFSQEEIDLINNIGLFTVEEAYKSLNDKGLWDDYYSCMPHDDITEEDIIIEKMVKTLFNMKRGYYI